MVPAPRFIPGRSWPLGQICRLNIENPTHRDFRVVTQGVEVDAGWIRRGETSGEPRKLYTNFGRAAGQDDDGVFALIWNPADQASAALVRSARGPFSRRILF